LSLISLFASLPKSRRVYVERVHLCKRLLLEFMHQVILSKSLRKCFISIKGYYFQAEIKGQKVTWIMPHKLSYQTPDDVDFRIMSTFVEFYSIMLGFVNFKAYQDLGLIYPPKLAIASKKDETKSDKLDEDDFNDEYLASLNCDFVKVPDNLNADDNENGDEFTSTTETTANGNPDMLERAEIEAENLKKLKNLFKGLKFFLNREVPREPFVFAVRAFSGEVSWDKITGLGATYQENDPSITHHIVDRPVVGQMYMNRVYVQPQWVFDCINENLLLPVDDYLPGAVLPPHLSPFVEIKEGDYVPPEKQRMIKMKLGIQPDDNYVNPNQHVVEEVEQQQQQDKKQDNKKKKQVDAKKNKKQQQPVAVEEEEDEENEQEEDEDEEDDDHGMKVDIDSPDENEDDVTEEETFSEDDEAELKKRNKNKKPLIGVSRGQVEVENLPMKLKKQADEEKKLTEMTIPKKNRRLFNKIMHSQKKTTQENKKLEEKRKKHDEHVQKKIQAKKVKTIA
jgi:pescadillo protein